jgi:hypothetical protein
MLLRKKWRKRVREIARQNYVTQTGERDSIAFRAMVGSQKQIKEEFGTGIITSILMSIMIKLAWKYIEKWVEEKLFAQHVPTEFNEDI